MVVVCSCVACAVKPVPCSSYCAASCCAAYRVGSIVSGIDVPMGPGLRGRPLSSDRQLLPVSYCPPAIACRLPRAATEGRVGQRPFVAKAVCGTEGPWHRVPAEQRWCRKAHRGPGSAPFPGATCREMSSPMADSGALHAGGRIEKPGPCRPLSGEY